MNLPHQLVVERATEGTLDEYRMPAQTWAALGDPVPGWIQPKSARELAQLSQGGPVATTHTIYLLPTDLRASDRIVAATGAVYEIDGIRDAAGVGHHLEIDAHLVSAS